jgi:Rho-binding antiterminator
MTDYVPIACAVHEQLEFAVLKRTRLNLRYREGGQMIQETVLPVDVATCGGAEWLRIRRNDGSEAEIRLDAIESF